MQQGRNPDSEIAGEETQTEERAGETSREKKPDRRNRLMSTEQLRQRKQQEKPKLKESSYGEP